MKKLIGFLLILAVLCDIATSVKVICYYMSSASYGGINPENLDVSLCSYINYAFISVKPDGNLKVIDENLDIQKGLYKRVTALKNKNPKLKVLLSVGGAGSSAVFKDMAANPSKRSTFVGSATYFLSQFKFDGLDIDWEYPEQADKNNYITLLRELKAKFRPKRWLLTAAVAAYPEGHGYNAAEMNKYLDFVNVMSYDFYGPWSKYTGQNSPLYPSSVESAWEKAHLNVAASANIWAKAGISKNKLAIGTAFYGRSFTLSNANNHGLHAGIKGPGADGGAPTYAKICSDYRGWTRVWDNQQKNPYKYHGNQWVGYDDKDSISIKAAWIKNNGFFGVMIWAINQDDMTGKCGQKQILLRQINYGISH